MDGIARGIVRCIWRLGCDASDKRWRVPLFLESMRLWGKLLASTSLGDDSWLRFTEALRMRVVELLSTKRMKTFPREAFTNIRMRSLKGPEVILVGSYGSPVFEVCSQRGVSPPRRKRRYAKRLTTQLLYGWHSGALETSRGRCGAYFMIRRQRTSSYVCVCSARFCCS